jgi:hypothetical protein
MESYVAFAYIAFAPLAAAWAVELGVAVEELRGQLITALQEPLLAPVWGPPSLALLYGDGGTPRLEGVLAADFIDTAKDCEDEVAPRLRAKGRPVDLVDIAEAVLGAKGRSVNLVNVGEAVLGAQKVQLLLWRPVIPWLARRWGLAAPSWCGEDAEIARLADFLAAHPGVSDEVARDAAEKQVGPIPRARWRKARRQTSSAVKLPRGRPRISDKDN